VILKEKLIVSTRLKNRIAKIKAEKELGSPPIIVLINFGSDSEEDWTKAEADAMAKYKKIHRDVDVRGARIVRLGFVLVPQVMGD
jgi:hypothetical protein